MIFFTRSLHILFICVGLAGLISLTIGAGEWFGIALGMMVFGTILSSTTHFFLHRFDSKVSLAFGGIVMTLLCYWGIVEMILHLAGSPWSPAELFPYHAGIFVLGCISVYTGQLAWFAGYDALRALKWDRHHGYRGSMGE